MSEVFKFFLNALKALFLSPFYLCYYLIFFIYSLLCHLYGEVRLLISGFRYGTKNENIYERQLRHLKKKEGKQNA